MRDYSKETEKRVAFIRRIIEEAGASGIVFGNSGGKDSALVGILCKKAVDNTAGIIMPCGSSSNYGSDKKDAEALASTFGIESRVVDLAPIKQLFLDRLSDAAEIAPLANVNIAPRLRMTTLYAVAASENRLVAGCSNRSEMHMGYFTKWGDGAYDFNPIGDLTVTEVYEFLAFLKAPSQIMKKTPSGGLFDNQTDESEMGITYKQIDDFLLFGNASDADKAIIERFHNASGHKRTMPKVFKTRP